LNESIILTTTHNINTSSSNSNLGKSGQLKLSRLWKHVVISMSRWSTSSLHTISNNTLSLWKLSGQRRQWMLDYLHDHTQKKDRP